MSDPFIGEIKMVGFSFAPYGWAFCNGQILSIQQNSALFALLGTTYGGDGKTTFGLPNLQGHVPIGFGAGPGLTPRTLGETDGSAAVTLNTSQMPLHSHTPLGTTGNDAASPEGHTWGTLAGGRTPPPAYQSGTPNVSMHPAALASAGNNIPHNNLQPYLAVNFVIALQGIFPSRS